MNILLTSAGRRSYIVDYFKNCVGVDKVYVSNSVYTIACKRADDFFISPLIYSDEYIPSIIAYCKEKGITVVLSLFDIDLLVLAKNESSFSDAGIELVLAPSSFIDICNDKWKTYKFIKALKLKTPKTYITVDTVVEAVKRGVIRYPLIMKPRWGMASMDIYTIDDEEELRVLTNKCKKDIFNSYLKYESSMTEAQAIVYQEKISGNEYGLDILNDLNGNYVATFAKQKLAMRIISFRNTFPNNRRKQSSPRHLLIRLFHDRDGSVCYRDELSDFKALSSLISRRFQLSSVIGRLDKQ